MSEQKGNEIFACVNSGKGFKSYFGEILEGCDYIYAVKGGPGTGKSGLIRHIAEQAEARGEEALRILCSSDPASHDGVVLPGRKVAVVDATSPHVYEIARPGAEGEYVNLGAYWDGKKLRSRRAEIEQLWRRKAACFDRAYAALAAAGRLRESQIAILRAHLDKEKLLRAVKRLCAKSGGRSDGKNHIRPVTAIGMTGETELPALWRSAGRIETLTGYFGGEQILLSALESACGGAVISPEKLTLLPQSVYFARTGLLVRGGAPLGIANEHVTSPAKYFTLTPGARGELRAHEKVVAGAVELAKSALAEAAESHFALESIYGCAMDFSGVDAEKERLTKCIFGATST